MKRTNDRIVTQTEKLMRCRATRYRYNAAKNGQQIRTQYMIKSSCVLNKRPPSSLKNYNCVI